MAGKQRPSSRKTQNTLAGSGVPWITVVAVAAVVVFAGGIFGYVFVLYSDKTERAAAVAPWTPSETNRDPSRAIPGVVVKNYEAGQHVQGAQRVAYEARPGFGGPHDGVWAACNGQVYETAVRTENLVHSLEHGAVWIAYNPDRLDDAGVAVLRKRVDGQQYMTMSPYPGLDGAISLQSWGHQLKLNDPNDPRIDQFIRALRTNQYTYPEVGASCEALGPGTFDPAAPPPFNPGPPGPGAVPASAANAGGGDAPSSDRQGA